MLAAVGLHSRPPFYWKAIVTGKNGRLYCGCQFICLCLWYST